MLLLWWRCYWAEKALSVYLIIAGGGKVGFFLAQELIENNHEVLVIEKDSARAEQLHEVLGGSVLAGDACEASVLEGAGVGRADLILAVTGDDEDNFVVCEIARFYGSARPIARINNPQNDLVFKRRGIETTISATEAILSQIEQELPDTQFIPVMKLHHGLELVELKLNSASPVVGDSPAGLALPSESHVVLIIDSDGIPKTPSGEVHLSPDDSILLITRVENRSLVRQLIIGSSQDLDT